MTNKTTIYLNPPIKAALQGAASTSGRLGAICDRYTEIMRRARIAEKFTPAELYAIFDYCNGTVFSPAELIRGVVAANVGDSGPDGLAEKWGVDLAALEAKARALSYVEEVALVEGIEAYWRENG